MSIPSFTKPNTAIDLTNLGLLKQYLGVQQNNTIADLVLQLCITAASVEWIWRTGRGPEGVVPAASPFVTPQPYDEFYDGNGSVRQFLRNWPIVSVQSLLISGRSISLSTGFGFPGYVIDQSKKSLSIRSFLRQSQLGRAPCGAGFDPGVQNVQAIYTAGFTQVPQDIVEKCTKMVAVNYRRTGWLDMASKSESSGGGVTGTTSYRAWEIPPDVAKVMQNYTRDLAV
jgi:hypothetical protein